MRNQMQLKQEQQFVNLVTIDDKSRMGYEYTITQKQINSNIHEILILSFFDNLFRAS